ncbi:MAG: GerMN domain-containing protein [Bacillota bacterium]|jgi:germination protein M
MKKVYIVLIIVALIFTITLSACSNQGNDKDNTRDQRKDFLQEQASDIAVVYYLTNDNNWLIPITMPINSTRQVAETSVEKLLAGAPNQFMSSPIPENTKLISIYSIDGIIFLDLTREILNIEPALAQKALDCLTNTVLFLDNKAQLQILVEGQTVKDLGGIDISQPISLKLINSNSDTAADENHITCYFSDNMAMYLVPKSYPVSLENVPEDKATLYLAQQTVKRLIKGPDTQKGLTRTIWPNTKLLDCSLNKKNLTLNFSPELLDYSGGTTAESMLVNSLLYSLTSIQGINSINILIDGEIIDYLPEGTDISQALTVSSPLNYLD